MKRSLPLLAALFFLNISGSFSQSSLLSLSDSLVGFDEGSLIDAASYRGITPEEMPVYLSMHKRAFIKQKYNIKDPVPVFNYDLESKNALAACVNEDFEEGSLTSPVPGTINITTVNGLNGWTCGSGVNSTTVGSCIWSGCCTATPQAIQVIAPGPSGLVDPIIGSGYPIHSVFGNSLNVNATAVNGFNSYGEWFCKLNNMQGFGNYNQIVKTITVTPSNVFFNFAYMAVIQGAHCCCDNGGISILFKDCLGNMLASASQFSVSPAPMTGCTPSASCVSPSTIAVVASSLQPTWYYNQWVISSIDLTTWMGTCIKAYITGIDCPYGAHAGYAYFDAQCGPTLITGINSIDNKTNYKVYPNPTAANFNIDIARPIENGEIELRNVLGQVVLKQKVEKGNNPVKTENLAKGIYNYSVLQNKEVVSVGKIVIE